MAVKRIWGLTRRRRFMARAHHCGPPEARDLRAPIPFPEVPWPCPRFTRSARVFSTR